MFMYKFLCRYMSFLFSKYIAVKFPNCFQLAAPFYIPTAVCECFSFSTSSSKTCYYLFFLKAILVSLKWYLIVVWACIFVKTNGLPRWSSGKESACQCRRWKRCGFDPWFRKIPWSRKCQPTPVFLPGKFHGQRSLTGYSAWGCKESDTTKHTQYTQWLIDVELHFIYFLAICVDISIFEKCLFRSFCLWVLASGEGPVLPVSLSL